jgi:hypothetical protein
MLMENKVFSDGAREFSMTWIQNQPVEMQAFSRIGVMQGQREKEDGKMKVYPTISMKTKDGENLRQVDPAMSMKTSWLMG